MKFYQILVIIFSVFFMIAQLSANPVKLKGWVCVYHHEPTVKLLASGADLFVLDPDAYSSAEIKELRSANKIVFAYLSVGEAETYRKYYSSIASSGLIIGENPDWKENFAIKYWEAGWKETLLKYSKEILNKGFNGLFVDVVDAWQLYEGDVQNQRKIEMQKLLTEIGFYLKSRGLEKGIIVQNSHELLDDAILCTMVYGINQESLFASWATDSIDPQWQSEKIAALDRIRHQGKLVTTIEYTRDRVAMARIRMKTSRLGFLPYFSVKELDRVFSVLR
ncbi:MAG: endo alpha-1,4 polygalactosaminidase [Candidatus Rifleibacteriota bacterium]